MKLEKRKKPSFTSRFLKNVKNSPYIENCLVTSQKDYFNTTNGADDLTGAQNKGSTTDITIKKRKGSQTKHKD